MTRTHRKKNVTFSLITNFVTHKNNRIYSIHGNCFSKNIILMFIDLIKLLVAYEYKLFID